MTYISVQGASAVVVGTPDREPFCNIAVSRYTADPVPLASRRRSVLPRSRLQQVDKIVILLYPKLGLVFSTGANSDRIIIDRVRRRFTRTSFFRGCAAEIDRSVGLFSAWPLRISFR